MKPNEDENRSYEKDGVAEEFVDCNDLNEQESSPQDEPEVVETPEEKCDCEHENGCECHENGCECQKNEDLAKTYLEMAQRLQADFDNYRKRVAEQLDFQRDEGKKSVIEIFLPCLDTFKDAKKNICDEKVLAGINMIEEKIVGALQDLGVEKIQSVGQIYNPHLHEGIAYMKDESQENDIILNEYQAGYTFKGKVIRYSKVIVNKL